MSTGGLEPSSHKKGCVKVKSEIIEGLSIGSQGCVAYKVSRTCGYSGSHSNPGRHLLLVTASLLLASHSPEGNYALLSQAWQSTTDGWLLGNMACQPQGWLANGNQADLTAVLPEYSIPNLCWCLCGQTHVASHVLCKDTCYEIFHISLLASISQFYLSMATQPSTCTEPSDSVYSVGKSPGVTR